MNKNNDHEIEQLIVHELNKLKKAVDSIEEAKETAIKSTSLLKEMESKYEQFQKRNSELNTQIDILTKKYRTIQFVVYLGFGIAIASIIICLLY